MSDLAIVDYSEHFPGALIAQGKGTNFLALSKLKSPYYGRFDGKPATYEVMYRWLSQPCENPKDEVYVCVQGSECTYWQKKELPASVLADIKTGKINLFDHFNLF